MAIDRVWYSLAMKTAFGINLLALAMSAVLVVPALAQTPAAAQPAAPTPAPKGAAMSPAPASVAGRVLTLDECIAIALEGQPKIQATLYDYAAARWRVNEAFASLLPQLTGSVSATRSQSILLSTSATTGVTAQFPINRTLAQTFQAQVQLSQLLFDFGKRLAGTEAARKLAEVAVENVELQRQLISLAVKEAYTNTLFAQRLIKVNQQALERAGLNLKSAKGFYEVGTRPKSDVARAEVDVANAKVDVIRAKNARRAAIVALNTAMAIDVDTPTELVDNLVFQAVALDRQQDRGEALKNRPEYRQVLLQVGAAQASERQAGRNFLPDVSGTGVYGGSQTPFLNENWALGLSLSWTLFDGGNLIARYQEAKANLAGANARVKATELDIIQNVDQAEIAVEEAQERIQAAQALVASAQENFRLAQGRFDAGVGTILELTDAQLALTQAQNTETQGLADYRIALARLDRAMGRR